MKWFFESVAACALMLAAAAPAGAQSDVAARAYATCNRGTGDIADCLNRSIADWNAAATAFNNEAATANYGSAGVTRYQVVPAVPPATTTTTTTTYSRTYRAPPAYPGASR